MREPRTEVRARLVLVGATVAALAVVLALAVWSATSELDAALADFSHEQEVLARAVGADFEHRLQQHDHTSGAVPSEPLPDDTVLSFLGGARRLEDRGEVMVLVARPRDRGFLTTDRRVIPSSRLRGALDAGQSSVALTRDEAPAFGLPRRRAVAGLSRATSGRGVWGVVVLASTDRLRTRERHEEIRLVVILLVAAGVVTAFGAIARKREREQLELARRAQVASLEREREALLARADKMAALAALSTGIAHELGTPLGVIVGRVEQVLARDVADARATQALKIVLEQVERIQRIVRGCLALARGDAPQLVRVQPATVAARAVELVRHRFEQAEVLLESRVAPDLPEVSCEPSLFEQALVNVLLNACQASPRDGSVSLTVARVDRHVAFVVEDEGLGIPDIVAARAGEPFFSTKRDQGGSGLGLTIAREIVSHHGGELTLQKRAGTRGTRATLTVTT